MEAKSDSPRVLISYSHDSPEHEARVLAFSDRLRREGVDAVLDQYQTFPAEGWLRWMTRQVQDARFVLMVCTPTYVRRVAGAEKPGTGMGATWEAGLIQQLLHDAAGVNEKFIPVVFAEEDRREIPLEWRRYSHFLVSSEAGYEELYRLLTDQPKVKKPVLGRLRALEAEEAKTDYRNAVWNAPPRNSCFTGREGYLEAIHRAWGQTRTVALSGIGGIGKTQTAVEYAYRYRSEYQSVLWCVADPSLVSGFAGLANALGIPEKDAQELAAVASGVSRWLADHSGWLLVFDNVDTVEDFNLVRRLVPAESAGHILITTRLQRTGRNAKLVEVEEMGADEGALFLLRRAGLIGYEATLADASEVDRRFAREISREVDGLPLALDQAAAFIEEWPSTPKEYLELYRTEGARLRTLRGEVDAEHPSVTVTFSLAFSRLEEKNPAAADLVRVCAFLAPDAIPEEIFTAGGTKLGERLGELAGRPLDFAEAMRDAGRFALVRRNAVAKSLDMHRQVQEVLKDGMDVATRRTWVERVVAALADIFPHPEFRNWTQCERLLPHAKAAARYIADFGMDSQYAGHLLNQAAYYLDDRTEYAEAEPLYQRALAISEKALPSDHPNTATCLNNLAVLYINQGRYEEAEPLYGRALAIREKALGPEHSGTAASLNNLAELYRSQGRYEEAEPLYHRALAIDEKALGPDDPSTAANLNNLGLFYRGRGRYEESEPLYQRALAIREKALGPGHPDTAASLNNLAVLYRHQGRNEEAEPLYQRALAIREKALGPKHPDTANSLNNLAVLYRIQGLDEQAEPLLQRALAISEEVLGPDHSFTTIAVDNYAGLLEELGRGGEAAALRARIETTKRTRSQRG